MSARLGNPPGQALYPYRLVPATNNGANGRILTPPTAIAVAAVSSTWIASATVGSRLVQLRILDQLNNTLLAMQLAAAITAGQTVSILAMTGLTIANISGPPIVQTLPWPMDCPVLGSIQMVDTANIDGAGDSISLVALASL